MGRFHYKQCWTTSNITKNSIRDQYKPISKNTKTLLYSCVFRNGLISISDLVFGKNKSGLPNAFIWRTISNLEKKRKNNEMSFFNHMVGMKTTGEQININPLPQWNHIWQTPGKNWTGHQKTRWSPRESKIDLRLSRQSVVGTGFGGYICKIVRTRQ